MIDVARGIDRLPELAARLDAAPPTVFQRDDFALAWWRHFGAAREPLLVYVEDAGGRALVPLFAEHPEDATMTGVIGAGVFDQLDVRIDGAPDLGRVGRLLREIVDGPLRVDATEPTSALTALLTHAAPRTVARTFSAMPVVRTAERTVDDLRRAHARGAYRNRRLRGRGAELREVEDVAEAERVIAAAFALKRASLTEGQRRWMIPDARYEAWLRDVAARHLGGLVRVAVATVGGELAACVVYFATDAVWSCYFTVFDRRFARDSPGTALLWDVLERAVAAEVPFVNLLTGEQWYKLRWHDALRPLVSLDVDFR